MQTIQDAQPATARDAGSAWYVVFVLTVCYTLSFIDRQILALLVGPIKQDLQISDTQVGLLGGLAFSVFYTLMGMPIGRLVDRYNRRNIIALGVAFWSVMTAACAFARGFPGLFLARMGVGLGEATLNPAAASLISDRFPKERLASAMSFYSMGIYLGAGLALLVGGVVIQAVSHTPTIDLPLLGPIASWRVTFLIVGLPGLLVALWVLTLGEPQRKGVKTRTDGSVSQLSMRETIAELVGRWQSVLSISTGQMIQAIALYSFMLWAPVVLQRVHGWTAQDTGLSLGIVVLIGGCAGMFIGGWLSDRWLRQGKRDATLRVGAFSAFGACVMFGLAALARDNPTAMVLLFGPAVAMLAMPAGSCYAALQMILPNQVRGQAVAFYLFVANLGGLTLGPLLPGVMNDYVFRSEAAVGESLMITLVGSTLMAGLAFASGWSYYRRDYARMHGG